MKSIVFRLQVYYCCWDELMQETIQKYPDAQVDLIFSGNSRQHSEACTERRRAEMFERNKPEKKTGLAALDATLKFDL